MDTDFTPLGERAHRKTLEHIRTNGDEVETYYLEVKSDLDLEARVDIAKIAKFLLGAANRDPEQAARHFHGYAVLVIGAQQGQINGVARGVESHDLENKLRPYLGPTFPSFEFGRVPIDDDREALFIVAPPPEDGQPMFPCHRNFQGNRRQDNLTDGAIYVRGSSNTRLARSGEILRLIERGQGSGKPPIDIAIDLIGTVHRVSHISDVMDYLYSQKEQGYIDRLESSQEQPALDPIVLRAVGGSEPLTPEQKAARLENWRKNKEENMAEGRDHLLGVALEGLGLRITSHNRYITKPHLSLTFHNCMVVDYLEPEDADRGKLVKPVMEPRSRFPQLDYSAISPRNLASYPVTWSNTGGNAEIHLTPEAFRPNTPEEFDQDDYVIVARDLSSEHIEVTWRLTEAGNDEETSGTFTAPVSEVVHMVELFGKAFSS